MNKTAIITGAAKNIGKGIAKGLLDDGFTCFLLDVNKDALQRTVEELNANNGRCLEYVVDIANIEALDEFIEWLNKKTNSVDVLVNNVGYESNETVLSLSPASIKKTNAINIEGTFYLTSLVAKLMTETKTSGNIIFITSTHSSVTRMHPLYSSSKAGIEMFMKEAALELASYKIRVNAVAPGPVEDTETPRPNKYVPMGASLVPKDVSECLKFLISDNARFITGQTITVDGGFSVAHTHYWKSQDKF